MTISTAQIIQRVRSAGIIGAAWWCFPTYVKLQAKVDTVIANGSECEPLLSSDCSDDGAKTRLADCRPSNRHAGNGAEWNMRSKNTTTIAICALEKVLPKIILSITFARKLLSGW